MVVIGNGCRIQNKEGFGEGLKFTTLNRPVGPITSGACGGLQGSTINSSVFSFLPPLLLPGRVK